MPWAHLKQLYCIPFLPSTVGVDCVLYHVHSKRLRYPKVVVLLVLLVWWLDLPGPEDSEYQVVEFFSGVGRIASLAKHSGYKSAAVDIEYGYEYAKQHNKRSPMDINSNAGLMLRGVSFQYTFFETKPQVNVNQQGSTI